MAFGGGGVDSGRFGREELGQGLGKVERWLVKALAEGIEARRPELASAAAALLGSGRGRTSFVAKEKEGDWEGRGTAWSGAERVETGARRGQLGAWRPGAAMAGRRQPRGSRSLPRAEEREGREKEPGSNDV
ncbi:hypothetical protein GQ55_9G263500 [Panicum hallii var. hallii]|uniref:Uncharacterized protein n=1 Tax=Panicum hallii var. hallii TaxID=1504633 RepID=A0A2T7C767_9POAL|nr:hypothetical protein GQ55_9G263500 [Panicum hallii var. hallii]